MNTAMRRVLAGRQGEADGDEEPPPRAAHGEPPGEQERRDDERLGMEVGPADPLDRGVQQVRHGERQADPRPVEAVPGDQVHGQRAEPEDERLGDVQERRAGAEPVERREQQRDEVDVVAPELEAAHGHERLAAAGHEPEALVVDPEVERPRGEVGVVLDAEAAEDDGEGDDAGERQPDGGWTAQPVATTASQPAPAGASVDRRSSASSLGSPTSPRRRRARPATSGRRAMRVTRPGC